MKKSFLPFISFWSVVILALSLSLSACAGKESGKEAINDQYSMSYEFLEKPKLGATTLKVNVYREKSGKSTDLQVVVEYDMPSMRGHHGSGALTLKPNKNNDYLIPVQLMMPGRWEVTMMFLQDGKALLTKTLSVEV